MKRILVLEGDSEVRRVAGATLEASGFATTCVAIPDEALVALASADPPFDLALLDVELPGGQAVAFCRALRSDPRPFRATPLVLVGEAPDVLQDQSVQSVGAVDAITKPFDEEALLAVIESATRRIAAGLPLPVDPVSLEATGHRPSTPPDRASWVHSDPTLVLAGDLAVLPIGAILQLLQSENQTGILIVVRGGSEIMATLRNGLIDLVQSKGAGDEFRLGRFFIEEGLATPQEIEGIVSQRDGSEARPLGDLLVEAGKITQQHLKAALARQSSELVYEIMRWQRGWFVFHREPPPPLAVRAALSLPVARVMLEGVRRVDEWRVMEAKLGRFDDVLFQDQVAIAALGLERIPRSERLVLDAIDGRRTIREVVAGTHMSSFDVCRILYQFLESRLVRRRLP